MINNIEFIGSKLKQLRNISEMTLDEVSRATGISQSMISMIESGDRKSDFFDLRNILGAYNYTIGLFLSRIADEYPEYNFAPDSIVSSKKNFISIIKSEKKDKPILNLLRPIRHDFDIELLELMLPANTSFSKELIIIPAEIRGVCTKGTILIEFIDDEFSILVGEEFCFDGRRPFNLRNYKSEETSILIIINPPVF